jgi:hypothetical protein
MKYKRIFTVLAIMLPMFMLNQACSGSQKTTDGTREVGSQSAAAHGFQTLADYLRRDPSVRITGNGEDLVVYIRSADTISSNFEPLFVIDRNTFLNTYVDAARAVDVNDILSVRVLKPLEGTAEYGVRGGNGVIVIRTKKK